jgi:hypothetical protein
MLTPNIAGMSKPKFPKSISTAMPTNGAARNPKANKTVGMSMARTRICFCEMSAPMNTPSSIKLIAETHCIKRSASLPSTLESLRSSKDRETRKTNAHTHKSFVRFIASP